MDMASKLFACTLTCPRRSPHSSHDTRAHILRGRPTQAKMAFLPGGAWLVVGDLVIEPCTVCHNTDACIISLTGTDAQCSVWQAVFLTLGLRGRINQSVVECRTCEPSDGAYNLGKTV